MIGLLTLVVAALQPYVAFHERRIYHYGPSTQSGLLAVNARLAELSDSSSERIELHLQGGGGDVLPALFVSDTLQTSHVPVDTYVDGYTTGVVTLLAISGRTRFIPTHGLITLPELSEDDVLAEYMQQIMLQTTNLDPDQLRVLLDRKEWLRAEPALYFKLFDKLLQ